MGGATAVAPEGLAAVAAVNAGCDMLLYPTDWAGVARALERVEPERAEQAIQRYEKAVAAWVASPGAVLDDATLAEHQQFADRLADRAAHLVRGDRPQLGKALSVTIVTLSAFPSCGRAPPCRCGEPSGARAAAISGRGRSRSSSGSCPRRRSSFCSRIPGWQQSYRGMCRCCVRGMGRRG